MSKNLCGKTRKVDQPYEIWKLPSGRTLLDMPDWEWRVLKKWQSEENEAKNAYARWFCAVKSPATYGSWEYGDTYVRDIKQYAVRVA